MSYFGFQGRISEDLTLFHFEGLITPCNLFIPEIRDCKHDMRALHGLKHLSVVLYVGLHDLDALRCELLCSVGIGVACDTAYVVFSRLLQ